MNISIIIPIEKEEKEHFNLVKQIEVLLPNAEIIISTGKNRAEALNKGARKATKDYLWFLHSDSKITADNISKMQFKKNMLFYYKLAFYNSSFLMRINAIGANLRSIIFNSPFGDQGFLLCKKDFVAIGGYNEDLLYGEDHIFIHEAFKKGIKIKMLDSSLQTSARKYQKYGWLKITLLHNYLWLKQFLKIKLCKNGKMRK